LAKKKTAHEAAMSCTKQALIIRCEKSTKVTRALFSSSKKQKYFKIPHPIEFLQHMHGALNIDKKNI